jgi:outer membrane immunogenic protein
MIKSKMIEKILASVAICALPVFAANAADMPTRKAPPPMFTAAPISWTGFYIGLNGGGGVANYNRDGLYDSNPVHDSQSQGGLLFGVQAGYNMQFSPSMVAGLEADWQWSQFKKMQDCGAGPSPGGGCYDTTSNASYNVDWFGTVRARLGFLAAPNWMIYGTGGLAYGQVTYGALDYLPNNSATQSKTNLGWTAGLGTEYKIDSHWSIKAEYLYVDLGKPNFSPIAVDPVDYAVSLRTNLNIGRVGVNYAF